VQFSRGAISIEEAKRKAALLRAEAKEKAEKAAKERADHRARQAEARAAREAEEEAALPPSEKLLKAASRRDLDAVQDLIANHGADVTFVHDPPGVWGSCDRKTALHCALKATHGIRNEDVERGVSVVHALLAAGADVNAVRRESDWRGSGKSESAFDMLLKANATVRVRLLEDFIAKGADPNKPQVRSHHSMRTDGATKSMPLHVAAGNGDVSMAALLLLAGAAVDAPYTEDVRNERGYNQNLRKTALHMAVEGGSVELVGLLLAEGADPNAEAERLEQRPSGAKSPHDDPRAAGFKSSVKCVAVRETALHMAVRNKDVDLVRALLVGGADASALRVIGDGQGQTAHELCKGNAQLEGALKTAGGWTPETHQYFGEELKERVRTVLLTAKANDWALPDDAMHAIFTELAARDGEAPPATAQS